MTWLLACLVLVVLGGAAVVASGRWGSMPDLVDDRPFRDLPTGPLTAADLRSVRLDVVPRGYSMTQVDELLAQLARQLPEGGGPPTSDERLPVCHPDAE